MVDRLNLSIVSLSEAGLMQKRRLAAQGLVEYALIIAFMAIVVIGILAVVGETLCTSWWLKIIQNPAFGDPSFTGCS